MAEVKTTKARARPKVQSCSQTRTSVTTGLRKIVWPKKAPRPGALHSGHTNLSRISFIHYAGFGPSMMMTTAAAEEKWAGWHKSDKPHRGSEPIYPDQQANIHNFRAILKLSGWCELARCFPLFESLMKALGPPADFF